MRMKPLLLTTSAEFCFFNPSDGIIGLCPEHVENPVYALVHELCHRDLCRIFMRMGLSDASTRLKSGVDVDHIMSPHKGLGFGRCTGDRISCGTSPRNTPFSKGI